METRVAHKKFGQKKDTATAEPITFDIGDEEGISCRSHVNGKLLIELVGKVDSGNVSRQSEGILEVFGVCVRNNDGDNPDDFTGKPLSAHTRNELAEAAEEDIEPGIDPTSSLGRLNAVLDDPDTEISVDELAELVGWLVEQYTARPTQKAASSQRGTAATKPTSRARRRNTAGTGDTLTSVSAST